MSLTAEFKLQSPRLPLTDVAATAPDLTFQLESAEQPRSGPVVFFIRVITLDDHEVDTNWADEVPQDPDEQSREAFLARRANALRAYYEHMPIRPSRMPDGTDMPLYRNFTFGDLLEINILDTRQYRSNQACGDGLEDNCGERFVHSRTMLGNEQEEWLLNNLGKSTATWDVLAQQVMMAQLDHDPGSDRAFGLDLWAGYVAARERLFAEFAE